MTRAQTLLSEIVDYFAIGHNNPGDHWCHDEDGTTFALDYKGKDGRKFWLDLHKDGTVSIFWKRPDGTHEVLTLRDTP